MAALPSDWVHNVNHEAGTVIGMTRFRGTIPRFSHNWRGKDSADEAAGAIEVEAETLAFPT